jgi:hypothetical protein
MNMTNKTTAFALALGLGLAFTAPAFASGNGYNQDKAEATSQTSAPEAVSSKARSVQYQSRQAGPASAQTDGSDNTP